MDKSLLFNHVDQPRSMIKEQSCKANEPPLGSREDFLHKTNVSK